jgi:hypothetical protein
MRRRTDYRPRTLAALVRSGISAEQAEQGPGITDTGRIPANVLEKE